MTGVLPIALGKSTKIVQALLKAGKEYVCFMHIHKPVSEQEIRNVMEDFVGEIEQMPPLRSVIKRRLRKRIIYYIDILEIDGQDVLFKVGCEAGTYIRKLCFDIGKKLKINAHMQQLIRTKVAAFNDEDWVSLHDLKDSYEYFKQGDDKEIRKIILPIEKAVGHLKKVWIQDSAVDPVCHGSHLYVVGISKLNDNIEKNNMVAIMTLKNELIGLGIADMNSKEMMIESKGIAVKANKVLMERKFYSI